MSQSPHIRLEPFRGAALSPAPATVVPGEDGLAIMAPLVEPISAGAPPVLPTLARRVEADATPNTRSVVAVNGVRITAALATRHRCRWALVWPTLARGERLVLEAWLRDEVVLSDSGGLRGMDIEPDGPDTGVVRLRPTGNARWSDLDGAGFSALTQLDCEELF